MTTSGEPGSDGVLGILPTTVSSAHGFILFAALICTYLLASSIYSLILHPLSDVPGPRLCAISRVPYWIQHMQGKDVLWIHGLHRRYGSVVRFGPTDLSYNTGAAWKDINGYRKGKVENLIAQEIHLQPVNGVRSMITATQDNHARVRRLFSPAFSDRALKKQEPLFRTYSNLLLSKIQEAAKKGYPVEMTQLFNFTTFDTMAQLCFGHSLGLLEKNELSPWVQSIFASLRMLPIVTLIAYYPITNALFTRFEPKWITAQREAHCQHSADRVDLRLQEGSNKPDIWNLVMSAREAGDDALSLEEMHSNAELFMLAGSETTATLLSGATYYLLSNRTQWDRLTNEIRSRFRKTDDMNFENLAECKFLNACLKEALRVYPPVPIGSPRIIPKGGQLVLDKWIPQDTRVSVHHYSTYHSADNFRDPDQFVPERWMGHPDYANDTREAHQPFGSGPRNCLGQNMAMHEMKLILASVVLLFDLDLCEQSSSWLDQQTFALWSKNPLMCRVTPVSA